MSQFKNSEIMVEFASIIQDQDGFRKCAWTSRDLTKALALEGIIAGGIAGAGAAGVGSAGATGVAGALTALVPVGGGAAAAGGGAAAGGIGAAIASNPIGWIIGAVLLVGGTAAAIYFAVSKTDDNLKDLISRIEALDYEDTPVKNRVQSWIDGLTEKLDVFQLPEAGAQNEEEKIQQLAMLSSEMEATIRYLEDEIWAQWPETKKYLEDWQTFPFNDPKDFEESFKKTHATLKAATDNIKKQSRKAMGSFLNPTKLMKEIGDLEAQITKAWAPPQYDPAELDAIKKGKNWVESKTGLKEYGDVAPKLVELRDDLKTKILPEAMKRRGKRSSIEHPISKRAVSLPDTPSQPVATPEAKPGRPISKRPHIPRNDVVENLQGHLNHLKVALQVPFESLKQDGRYGPKTADALVKTLDVVGKMNPDLLKWLQWQGIPVSRVTEIQLMNSNPAYITQITRVIGQMVDAIRTGGPETIKDFTFGQQAPGTPGQPGTPTQPPAAPVDMKTDIGRKQNPSREEMLAYFKGLHGTIGGDRVNLYDYAQQNLGMSDNDIFNMLYSKYPGWAPKAWSVPNIIDAMGKRYSIF
jgi:hypothetical protein